VVGRNLPDGALVRPSLMLNKSAEHPISHRMLIKKKMHVVLCICIENNFSVFLAGFPGLKFPQ
jgi:hypothetical protein